MSRLKKVSHINFDESDVNLELEYIVNINNKQYITDSEGKAFDLIKYELRENGYSYSDIENKVKIIPSYCGSSYEYSGDEIDFSIDPVQVN